jgi:hypothetical protein
MLVGLILPLVQPDFHSELSGVVNSERLIEFFREIGDRGELEAQFIRDDRFRFAPASSGRVSTGMSHFASSVTIP